MEVTTGGAAGHLGDVDDVGAEVDRTHNGMCEGLHRAESCSDGCLVAGLRTSVLGDERGAGLPDRDDRGFGGNAAEGVIGGRDRSDDPRHQRAVAVAVLGSVGTGDVVATGGQSRQPWMPGDAGIDHRDLLSGSSAEPPGVG